MQIINRFLATLAVVVTVLLNVAGGKAFLLSLATVCDEHRNGCSAAVDSTAFTQIWTDSRDPDPAAVVHDNGARIQWEGEMYRVVSVVQSGAETLYICSRDESLTNGWLRITAVSRGETNPLKLALSGRIISEYFTPQSCGADASRPSIPARFFIRDTSFDSVIPAITSPPPRVS